MGRFELSELENKKAESFKKWHKRCRPPFEGETFKIYKPYAYIFETTGIGNSVSIKCPYCGKVKNITDVDCW